MGDVYNPNPTTHPTSFSSVLLKRTRSPRAQSHASIHHPQPKSMANYTAYAWGFNIFGQCGVEDENASYSDTSQSSPNNVLTPTSLLFESGEDEDGSLMSAYTNTKADEPRKSRKETAWELWSSRGEGGGFVYAGRYEAARSEATSLECDINTLTIIFMRLATLVAATWCTASKTTRRCQTLQRSTTTVA